MNEGAAQSPTPGDDAKPSHGLDATAEYDWLLKAVGEWHLEAVSEDEGATRSLTPRAMFCPAWADAL
jgi:hypothetical protein